MFFTIKLASNPAPAKWHYVSLTTISQRSPIAKNYKRKETLLRVSTERHDTFPLKYSQMCILVTHSEHFTCNSVWMPSNHCQVLFFFSSICTNVFPFYSLMQSKWQIPYSALEKNWQPLQSMTHSDWTIFISFIHSSVHMYFVTFAKLMSWESNVLHHVYRCQSVFNLLSFFHIWIAVYHHLSFVFEKNLWNALENIFKLQHFLVNRFRIYFFLEKRYLA